MNKLYRNAKNIKVICEEQEIPQDYAYYSVVKNTDTGNTLVFQIVLDNRGKYCYLLCFRSDIISMQVDLSSGYALHMMNFWFHGEHRSIPTYDGTVVYLAMPRAGDGNDGSRIALFNNNGLLRRQKLNLYDDVPIPQLCTDVLGTFRKLSHSRKQHLIKQMKSGAVLKFVFVDLEDRQIWWKYDKKQITRAKHLVFQYSFDPHTSEYIEIAQTAPKHLRPLQTGMLYFSTISNKRKPALVKFDTVTNKIESIYETMRQLKHNNGQRKPQKMLFKKILRKNNQLISTAIRG